MYSTTLKRLKNFRWLSRFSIQMADLSFAKSFLRGASSQLDDHGLRPNSCGSVRAPFRSPAIFERLRRNQYEVLRIKFRGWARSNQSQTARAQNDAQASRFRCCDRSQSTTRPSHLFLSKAVLRLFLNNAAVPRTEQGFRRSVSENSLLRVNALANFTPSTQHDDSPDY